MRLIAVADVHLGHFAYRRLAPDGENQRSVDVGETFARFVDTAIELRPDLITVAGDVFHHASPRNRVAIHAVRQFGRLTRALPDTIVVCVSGNHDHSRVDGSSMLPILAELPNVYVAHPASMRYRFPDRDLSILAVPDVPMQGRPSLRPSGAERYQVLVLHGEAMGVKQGRADTRCALTDITPAELGADEWSWVSLGHYHEAERVAPRAMYSGSLDFTSSNPWQEIATPKGFVEVDLATGAETFHVLEPSRRFIDLEPLYGQGLGIEELDRRIADALEAASIDGAVVRLKVLGVPREVERGLNQKALRSFARRALFLKLDVRRPAAVEAVSASGAPLGRRQFSDIEEKVRAFCRSDARDVPADVDKGAMADLAVHYLREAAAKEADSPEQETKLANQLTQSIRGAA